MTNQPLTAEQIALDVFNSGVKHLVNILGQLGLECDTNEMRPNPSLQANIEAYAAQQNAELVAKLSGQIVRLEADYKLAIEEIKNLKGELAQAELKASQRGKAWIELSSENERLKEALQSVIEVDKTIYKHHEPRPDGRLPKENGGTIWFTPKEIAKMVLPQPPKEAT